MGYRISYEPIQKLRYSFMLRSRFLALWSIFFAAFLTLTRLYWPRGWEVFCQGLAFAQGWTAQLLNRGIEACAAFYDSLQVFADQGTFFRKA